MKHVVDIHSEMTGMDIYILCDDEEMGDRIEARFFDLVGEEDGLPSSGKKWTRTLKHGAMKNIMFRFLKRKTTE